MNTCSQVRASLQSRRGDWPLICASTGLSYWWVTKFAQGRIQEPGLSKIEKLQGYFSEHPLPPDPDTPEARRPPAAEEGAAEATPAVPVSKAA